MNEELKELITKYKQTKWDELLREDLGKHHLKEIKPSLDDIKKFIDPFIEGVERNDHFLSGNQQNILQDILHKFDSTKTSIQGHFNIHEKQTILDRVIDLKNLILDNGYNLSWALEINKKHDSNQDLNEPQKDVKKYQSAIKKLEAELQKTIQLHQTFQSKQAGQMLGPEVLLYGDLFKKEAENNKKSGWFYGVSVLVVSLLSIWLAHNFFIFDPHIIATNIPELIIKGNIINKIFIFSIIILLISLLSREYMALKHQYTLNKLRHNALSSHREILNSIKKTESESDKEISNAILLELTKAMFAYQDTGFVKNQKDLSSGNKIIEISKPLFKSSK